MLIVIESSDIVKGWCLAMMFGDGDGRIEDWNEGSEKKGGTFNSPIQKT